MHSSHSPVAVSDMVAAGTQVNECTASDDDHDVRSYYSSPHYSLTPVCIPLTGSLAHWLARSLARLLESLWYAVNSLHGRLDGRVVGRSDRHQLVSGAFSLLTYKFTF